MTYDVFIEENVIYISYLHILNLIFMLYIYNFNILPFYIIFIQSNIYISTNYFLNYFELLLNDV